MNINEQFTLIAQEYDVNRKKFIPCFDDYYKSTTKFITANLLAPKAILDLGAGTGLLSYFWYQHFPNSKYVLLDIAEEMLNVAKKRFSGLNNVFCKISDYSKKLPEEDFDCIISALSIHHLEHDKKRRLFKQIYEKLPTNGIFVNYDQFCASNDKMEAWYYSFWKTQMENSGLTERDLDLWQERRKLDRECSVDEEIAFLKESGFLNVQCVYSYQKFSVITAIK